MSSIKDKVKKSTQEIEQQSQKSELKAQQGVQKTARVTEQSYRTIREAIRTREILGVRSENSIQREIEQTRNAYERLKNSGMLSSQALAKEARAAQKQISSLNRELDGFKTTRFANIGRGVMSVGAGLAVGTMALRDKSQKAMSYENQLAMASNTAFSERDANGRVAGMNELDQAIRNAVSIGGGTKENALSALDTMLASGAVETKTAMNLLPTLQKASVATGASTDDIARIAISAMQQMGIDENQIGAVLDKAVAAGQAGNFELSDMARWLPQQMAAAQQAGLSGMSGFEALLVANQQARVTAGTSDEAGNNLVNLLAKITSKETNQRFSKLDYIDPKTGKTVGIDLIGSMQNYKNKGMNSLDAFSQIIDDVVSNDKRYQQLKSKLGKAKKEDQKKLLEEMATLVEGTAVGQVISDRQALMALLGMRNNKKLGNEVKDSVHNADGAVETSHQVISSTAEYKTQDLKNTVEFSEFDNMKAFNKQLGDVTSTLSTYGKQYPELTQFLVGAKDAVYTFGAALATMSVMNSFGKGAGGIAGTVGAGAAGAGAAANASSVGFLPLATFAATAAAQSYVQSDLNQAKRTMRDNAIRNANPQRAALMDYAQQHNVDIPLSMRFSTAFGDKNENAQLLREFIEKQTGQPVNLSADIQQVGQVVSQSLEKALQTQKQVIHLTNKIELDGRVLYEHVEQKAVTEFNRG
ncbi:phage tail tape measure protein [Pasteurellaceae bacterium HPA106]|nr:phage tail tape measure protein [Spirabiliibacterium pneumoniae]